MEQGKRMVGIFLILISIAGLFVWEKWGKEQFAYEEVLVLQENVEKGPIIEAEMLTTKKMHIEEDYLSIDKQQDIIGKQAAAFIHKGVPIFAEYLQVPHLSPDQQSGRYAFALSPEWIASKPETLSRGDKVFFFYQGNYVTWAWVSGIGKDQSIEMIVTMDQAKKITKIIGVGGTLAVAYQ